MSKDDEDLIVEVPADEQTGVEPNKKEGDAPAKREAKDVTSPEEGVETLRAQLAAQKKRAEEAETRAVEAETRQGTQAGEAARSTAQTLAAHKTAAANAIEASTSALDAAKGKYVAAMTAENYEDAATAQADIASATLRLEQANTYKGRVDRYEEHVKQQAERGEAEPNRNGGLNTSGLSGKSRAWVLRNAEAFEDPRTDARIKAAHFAALGEGIVQDSEDYFERLDAAVAGRSGQRREDEDRPARKPRDGEGAPPSRGATAGSQPRTVKLTREELETAAAMEMTPVEYAKELLADPNSRLNRGARAREEAH